MATPPALPPLGGPSQVEAATAKAELQIVLLPVKEAPAETKDKPRGSISQSGQLTAATARPRHLALALAVVGTSIRRRVSRQE